MQKTYKAIFECKGLNERVVWYVSSRREGRRHLRDYIGTSGKPLSKYRNNDWTYEVKPVFEDADDVHYDVVTSWSGL